MQSSLPVPLNSAASTPFLRTLTGRLAIVAATAFVALCAHISIPLPFTPVPLTLQPFAVILVGLSLGPIGGFAAMMLYLAEGATGLPVFTPQGPGGIAQLLGPTAGFLLSYPLAAAIAGTIARRHASARIRFTSALLAGLCASVAIYSFGAGWLGHLLHLHTAATLHLAVFPFLPGEVIKLVAAASIFSALNLTSRS